MEWFERDSVHSTTFAYSKTYYVKCTTRDDGFQWKFIFTFLQKQILVFLRYLQEPRIFQERTFLSKLPMMVIIFYTI